MIEEIIRITSDVGGAIAGLTSVGSASTSMSNKLQGIGGSLVGLGGKAALFTAPLAAGLGFATAKAVEFDTAMSGASRALDLSKAEVLSFTAEIKKIAPSLGQTPTKFAELATEAGKLGVAKDKIIGFTKVVAEIAAITDLSSAETTKLASSFGALQTIAGLSTEQLNIYGAAVNKLDDAIGGTTPQIVEFTRQTAATGKLLKLGVKDLAAYGSTMQALGIQNGTAYRSFNALLTKLAAPQTLSKKGQEAFADLGLSADQMSEVMNRNANEGIKLFLDRINALSKTDVSAALGAVKQIVGGDYGDEILTIAASSDKLAQALGMVGDTMDSANLAKKSDELAKKLGGVKGQQAILTAQMERMAITIGAAVLPSVTDLLGLLTPLIDKFATFAEQNPKLLKIGLAIAAIAVSVGPVLIVLGSLISAIGTISTLFSVVTPIFAGVGVIFAGMTLPIWGTIAAFVAVGVAIGALAAYWGQISSWMLRSWSSFAQNWMSGASVITSFLSNLASQAWTAGSSFIYNFFAGIGAYFSKGIEFFKSQLAYLRGLLPGSEPKVRSPLSNLADAGVATMSNFASGLGASTAVPTMNATLGTVKQGLVAPSGSSGGGGSGVVVNDNRTINIGSGGNGGIDIVKALKDSDRELLDLINKAQARWNRGTA